MSTTEQSAQVARDQETERDKILIVEDEHIVALDIKMHLERYGYEVPAMFPSGEEALAHVDVIGPSLVLMDVKLSGNLDGLQTAEEIRRRYNIPVIMLTAYADEATVQRAKITQPFAYIIKPFEERELRTAIVIALYRHRMEQEIVRRERLFSATLASLGEGVIVTDPSEWVTYINAKAQELLSVSENAWLQQPLAELMRLEQGIPDGFTEQETDAVELMVRPDGTRVPVEQTTKPLIDEYGRNSGSVLVFEDITERLESERELARSREEFRQAQKMEAVGRLSGGIAHDFNNLLTVIMGYSRLMKQDVADLDDAHREQLQSDIDGIQKAAEKSVNLTRQLLAFSRRQILKPEAVDINRTVADLEKMLRRLLTERIRLYLSLRATSAFAFVDQGQVEQIVLNLVVNARDAMTDGGTLTIRSANQEISTAQTSATGTIPPGGYVVLTVEDTGVGMDAETIQSIFDPFFTTKEQGQGTGLGLATVYGIMKQMAGYIRVESEPGKGARFELFFPLLSDQVRSDDDEAGERRARGGTETVLLVEDDEQIRSLLGTVLRGRGYTVMEAENAGEAVLIVEETSSAIDLVVSDIVMPHVSGDKLAERIRGMRPGVRVLLMSGYPDSFPSEDRLGEHMHFLAKPFSPEAFLEAVRNCLD
jgi:PAS domain S-box-containing protein